MNSLTKSEMAYGQQKNREYMYSQAISERKEMKRELKDISSWQESDTNWVDYRYMELCEAANITVF